MFHLNSLNSKGKPKLFQKGVNVLNNDVFHLKRMHVCVYYAVHNNVKLVPMYNAYSGAEQI